MDKEQTWVDRRAKLFEAGDYPDKGLTVTQDDLDRLSKTFDLPVPVLIEHANNPLEIGYLTDVESNHGELFGTLTLTREANDLVEASQAHALSLGLDSNLTQIQEVSLVKNPRVATARMFTGEVLEPQVDWKTEYERLKALESQRDARHRLQALVQEGRLLPVQLPFAEALIGQAGSVQFDGETRPLSHIVLSLLESAPAHTLLREHAPGATGGPTLPPDEQAFYDRYFAGLSIEDIARNRTQSTPLNHGTL